MSVAIRVSRSIALGGKTVGGTAQSLAAPTAKIWEPDPVAPGVTVATLAGQFDIDVSQIVSLAIESTQNGTLKTNTFASPTDTIPLVRNVPIIWVVTDDAACPLTADVTQLHFTNNADPGDNNATVTLTVGLNI
jgi:hypothetical protein